MKKKKRSHEFSIELDGMKHHVIFETYNCKVVKCKIIIKEGTNSLFEPDKNTTIFTGKSNCNLKLDTFSEHEGRRISLSRALNKRDKFITTQLKWYRDVIATELPNRSKIEYKFEKTLVKMEKKRLKLENKNE